MRRRRPLEVAPYIEAGEGTPLLDLTNRSLAMYDVFVARVAEASGRRIEYARTGTLEAALDEMDVVRLRGCAPVWRWPASRASG